MPIDFPKEDKYVYLQAISPAFTAYKKIPVSTVNGFLFIQTDKPLYTPEQEGQYDKNLSCALEREFMYKEKDGASKRKRESPQNNESICFLSTSACLLPQRGAEEI